MKTYFCYDALYCLTHGIFVLQQQLKLKLTAV